MSSSTSLPGKIRDRLETARSVLGLSQTHLSRLAGISQGSVSNCLQGQVVRVDSLRRLLSAFTVASAEDSRISPELANEIRKTLEEARTVLDGNIEPNQYIARPGAPMPERAANRIDRLEDQRLLRALDDAPFTAAVVGPPECGKSTLLQLLTAAARRRGFAVAEFDARIVLPPQYQNGGGSNIQPDEENRMNMQFFSELAYEVSFALSGGAPEVQNRFELARYLKVTRQRRPEPPLLVVVDHASEIPLALEELTQVCRSLDTYKGATQISWAIEVTDLFVHDCSGILSRLSASPAIKLSWFPHGTVEDFARSYGLEDLDRIGQLWRWFEGQPFLTHAALTHLHDLTEKEGMGREEAWRQLTTEVERLGAEFGRHVSRVRSRLRRTEIWPEKAKPEEFIYQCNQDAKIRLIALRSGLLRPSAGPTVEPEDLLPIYLEHLFRTRYLS